MNFFLAVDIGAMKVMPSLSANNFGQIISLILTCSADVLNDIQELGVPPPTFEWFFGPNGNASLPSGVAVSTVTLNNGTSYSNTLLFSLPAEASQGGIYTCRLGGNPRLVASITINITVSAGAISPDLNTEAGPFNLVYITALCSAILFVVLASVIVIIGLLCVIMR